MVINQKLIVTVFIVCFIVMFTGVDRMSSAIAMGEDNLILNPDFSLSVDAHGVPMHWTVFRQNENAYFELSDERSTVGSVSLKLIDNDPQYPVGLRSHRVDGEPGRRYLAEVDVFGEDGSGMLYIDFLDANGSRVQERAISTRAKRQWEKLSIEAEAPTGTAFVTVILYSSVGNVGTFYYDYVRLYDVTDRPISLDERTPSNRELGFLPDEGSTVRVNPPPMVWLPETQANRYTVEYGQDPAFTDGSFVHVGDVDLPLYTPSHTLQPGTWYWRYWAVSTNGEHYGPSKVRSFEIVDGLPKLPLPPSETWMARIPTTHPRMFLRPEDVQPLRDRLNLRAITSVFPQGHMASIIGVELPPEPKSPFASGSLDIDVWRSELNAITPSFEILDQLSFLYLLTEREVYAREGIKLLVHLASMDPSGSTSYSGAREVAMRLIYLIPRAYSWMYDAMSEEERDIVRQSARVRGEEAYQMLKRLPFETSPYSSHPGRMLGFLGQLSIAFFDEIEEARGWLDYVVQLMVAVYPAWGADDGGYSEGLSYWNSYMQRMFNFMDALNIVADLDLYKKPFFQNTGYFALYAGSIGTGQPFSDGINGRTSAANQSVMTHLARVTQNPHFSWYVQQSGGVAERSRFQQMLSQIPLPAAKAPIDLPNSRWFTDIGWVTLHRNLANPADNIQFTMKSSPYGSASHGHADQNAFVMYAYGDPVAISSGYYPYYGSPHHAGWTNQTLSKNSLLIDGKGQLTNSIDSVGEILGLFHSDSYDYTAGEAAQSYGNADLNRFTRHVIYIRPDLFLLVDDVRAEEPVSIDWLMHSRFPISWDDQTVSAQSYGDTGKLDVYFLTPNGVTGHVSDEFNFPPELTNYQDEWHLTASLEERGREITVITLLVPSKSGEVDVDILHAEARVMNGTIDVDLRYETEGQVLTENIHMTLADSDLAELASVQAVAMDESGALLRAFAGGDLLAGGCGPVGRGYGKGIIRVTPGWFAAATWYGESGEISIQLGRADALGQDRVIPKGDVVVSLDAPFLPQRVIVNGKSISNWSYNAQCLEIVI